MIKEPAAEMGERIKYARQRKSLTQDELAESIGVSLMAVWNWERGLNVPNAGNIRRLAEVLDVSIPWLVFAEE